MNTQIAIALGLLLIGLLMLDSFFFGWDGTVFLLKKGTDLIEWMAFWR